jgi:orotidine-5'-phosphate decarboxylase
MTRAGIIEQIRTKKSFLCVGLDTSIDKIPKHLLDADDPVFEFNKQIIDATHELAIAYKPNIAFYEVGGTRGWSGLEKTINYLNQNHPELFTIADAKRGDIGNTSLQYAQAFLSNFQFDAITVAPYMGADSVAPFLSISDKWVILLALTSNEGSRDFQMLGLNNGTLLYQQVLETAKSWGNEENTMFVVGATRAEMLEGIRKIVPDHFLLVPGVGAQGGSLAEVVNYGMNRDCGLLVNASRSIIYASREGDFAEKAREEAAKLQAEMAYYLDRLYK